MGKRRGGKLSPLHLKFCQEYVLSGNATDAYRKAGYKSKDADVCASRLLGSAGILAEISRLQAKVSDKFELTQELIIEELAAIAFARPADIFSWGGKDNAEVRAKNFSSLTEMQKRGLASIQQGFTETGKKYLKVQHAEKTRALELLGKQIGMWKKVKDAGGPGTGEESRKALVDRIHALIKKRDQRRGTGGDDSSSSGD